MKNYIQFGCFFILLVILSCNNEPPQQGNEDNVSAFETDPPVVEKEETINLRSAKNVPEWLKGKTPVPINLNISGTALTVNGEAMTAAEFKTQLPEYFNSISKNEKKYISFVINKTAEADPFFFNEIHKMIKDEYRTQWDAAALQLFKAPYIELNKDQRKTILLKYPLMIGEGE